MKNILRSGVVAALLVSSGAAQSAEGTFIYRHYNFSPSLTDPQTPEENSDKEFGLLDVPVLGLSKSNPFLGGGKIILYGKDDFFIGNGKTVAPMFFIRGVNGALDYTPKDIFSSFQTMPAEDFGDLGVDLKGVKFVQATIPIEYGDGISSVKVEFLSNGHADSSTFQVPREDFQHKAMSLRSENWPSSIDYPVMADEGEWSTNVAIRPRIEIEGGVPPYKVILDESGEMEAATSLSGNRARLNEANLEVDINRSALNAMSLRDENFQPAPQEMVHVLALEFSGSGAGNGVCGRTNNNTVSEKSFSVTVLDAVGQIIKSPVLTVRHQPDGMRCLGYSMITMMPKSDHLSQIPYLEMR